MRVFVYWNLHRHCWSIKALEGPNKGRVISHATDVDLERVEFKVSQAGRARVLREKRKNVHAGVVGTLVERRDFGAHIVSDKITYNPYRFASFVSVQAPSPCSDEPTFTPVRTATRCWMRGRDVRATTARA